MPSTEDKSSQDYHVSLFYHDNLKCFSLGNSKNNVTRTPESQKMVIVFISHIIILSTYEINFPLDLQFSLMILNVSNSFI